MSCQIAFVYGDQVATFVLESNVSDPYQTIQRRAAEKIVLDDGYTWEQVYFFYEDDDGDQVAIRTDVDLKEAISINEDGGSSELLLLVSVQSPVKSDNQLLSDQETSAEEKTPPLEEESDPVQSLMFDEGFVLEVAAFLNDPAVKQTLPEISAYIAAAVAKKASAHEIHSGLTTKFPFLSGTALFKIDWYFISAWSHAYDSWVEELTEDQLGKVAFQIPIICMRLFNKRAKLHHLLFVKRKPLTRLLKIKHFELGAADLASVYNNFASKEVGRATGHLGTSCASCGLSPIEGTRFKCMVCANVDLCEACEAAGTHTAEHALMKFKTASAGYLGVANASPYLGKKCLKMHLKALKHEAKHAKMQAKAAMNTERSSDDTAAKALKYEAKLAKVKAMKHEAKLAKKEAKVAYKLAKCKAELAAPIGSEQKVADDAPVSAAVFQEPMSIYEAKLYRKMLKHGYADPILLAASREGNWPRLAANHEGNVAGPTAPPSYGVSKQ
jgi:hypothetical protein